MGSAAAARVPTPDEEGPDGPGQIRAVTTRAVDVDDVRALLQELRLRRQLRAQD
jgi:hypothetical protein